MADAFVRFTVPDVRFVCPPSAGDIIEFRYGDWPERELAEVKYVYHACGSAAGRGAIVSTLLRVADHGDMLLVFDKFKDHIDLVDLDTDNQQPPPYYRLYRTLLKMWGKPTYDHGRDNPQALGGLVRAALLAAGYDGTGPIEILHTILIEDRKRNGDTPIKLLRLLLTWDRQTGSAAVAASARDDEIAVAAAAIFSGIKSVGHDQLPKCVRAGAAGR